MRGWIFDIYPRGGEMVVWLKGGGDAIRLVDRWTPSIYLAADPTTVARLTRRHDWEWRFEERFERIYDTKRSKVMRIFSWGTEKLGRQILAETAGRCTLYNVDVPAAQMYLYEKDLFPLAYVEAEWTDDGIRWEPLDSPERVDYELPDLKTVTLSVQPEQRSRLPTFLDPVASVTLQVGNEKICIESGEEANVLLRLVEEMRRLDPDIVLTEKGDSFEMPYLAYRAHVVGIEKEFNLSREPSVIKPKAGGRVYSSYGKVHYRPFAKRLLGRIHVDIENAFLFGDCGLDGMFEVARTCRMPLQRVTRSTIGTCMTSLQLYNALRRDVLIPWRKVEPEEFKGAYELIVADRGGFYYEPIMGVHDDVGELDFSSLYPTLMWKYNLSAETVRCACCPASSRRVPELGYNICERRRGIVPRSIEIIIRKREAYKELMRRAEGAEAKAIYDRRQAALKWVGVSSFGYLGFKNAKFGKIDAHIATCAFARDVLLKAAHLAEEMGFRLIHGIVDSLWLRREGSAASDFEVLARRIEEATGLTVSFEGRYRWVVFLPSKVRSNLPVLNRYYGLYEDGRIKARGIDIRRGDAPNLFKRCQSEMLEALAAASSSEELRRRVPSALKILERYIKAILSGDVDARDLIVYKQLSKDPAEYRSEVHQQIAASELRRQGVPIRAGQRIGFLIADGASDRKRIIPAEFVGPDTRYDSEKYIRLLLSSASTILIPFGYNEEELARTITTTTTCTLDSWR